MLGECCHRRGRSAVVVLFLFAVSLSASTSALAAGPTPKILSPSRSRVVAGKTATLKVRGPHVSVSVGSRNVTKRLGRPHGGVRQVKLRRGKDFHLGSNRVVVAVGKGRHRRYIARVFLAARPARFLSLKRLHGGLAAVEFEGHSKARLGRLLVTVNGKRLAQRRLIGSAGKAFKLALGVGDGLRYGANKVVVQGVSADGRRVSRLTREVHVARSRPLADAGSDRRIGAGQSVPLGGGGSEPMRPGDDVATSWQIVAAPRGSRAKLVGADTAHPRLLTDVPGRYRVRLTAREEKPTPRAAAPQAAASAAGPEGVDVMTVEASATDSSVGAPLQTLTGKGIVVGDESFPASSGWAQVLILERSTLKEISNQTIAAQPNGEVGMEAAQRLGDAIGAASNEDLVIVSGQGRRAHLGGVQATALIQTTIGGLGVPGGPLLSPDGTANFESGDWSAIGIPGTELGSGVGNFSGSSVGGFGNSLPAGEPGSLQGYLHYSPTPVDPADSELGGGFLFVSPDHAPIDTEGKGASASMVSIEVAGKAYDEPVLPGESGFDLLLLNDRLERISDQAYVTNLPGGGAYRSGIEELGAALTSLRQGAVRPGLVIMQSFGSPGGQSPAWVADSGISTYPWSNQTTGEESPLVPNQFSAWSEPGGAASLAAGVGWLAGPAAHDSFAQMVSAQSAPTPEDSGGFTLVVPYEEPAAAFVQSEKGSHLASARVIGDLLLNADSGWEITAPSEISAFGSDVLDVVYQAPQQWPDSGTPGFEAADRYIAERLHLGTTSVRAAYTTDDREDWAAKHDELKEDITYPPGRHEFGKREFEALKKQLLREISMVGSVQACFADWRALFTTSEGKGRIDLAHITGALETEIQADVASQTAELNSDLIVAHSIGIAAGLVSSTVVAAPVGSALGALSNTFSLANDLSSNKGGSLSALPVKAKASELGEELSRRYEALDSTLDQVEDMLVSDWGKLQAAGAETSNANGGWALDGETEPIAIEALGDSTSQQAASALMPLAYGEYMVAPISTGNNPEPHGHPWTYSCRNDSEFHPGLTEPLNPSYENPNSWIAFPYELEGTDQIGFFSQLQPRVMAIQGDFSWENEVKEEEVRVVHEPHVLSPAFANKLFGAPKSGGYGIDRVAFFGDPAFPRWPLYC
jgi:hypothetical protein